MVSSAEAGAARKRQRLARVAHNFAGIFGIEKLAAVGSSPGTGAAVSASFPERRQCPDRVGATGIEPSYEQRHFAAAEKRGRLRLVAAGDGRADGAVRINQDAAIYAGLLDGAESAELALAPGRKAYVHVARGSIVANGTALSASDALKLADVDRVRRERGVDAEVLVFDLP